MVYQNDDTETDTKIMYVVYVSVCNEREQDEKKSEEAKIDETRRGETRRDEMRRDETRRTDRQTVETVRARAASQPASLPAYGRAFLLAAPPVDPVEPRTRRIDRYYCSCELRPTLNLALSLLGHFTTYSPPPRCPPSTT